MKEKSIFKGIGSWPCLALAACFMVSCQDEDIVSDVTAGQSISFVTVAGDTAWPDGSRAASGAVESVDGILRLCGEDEPSVIGNEPLSRGVQITSGTDDWGFRVGAYYYAAEGAAAEDFFIENPEGGLLIGGREGSEGSGYYWPLNGKVSFLAVAPADASLTVPVAADMPEAVLHWSIPEDVEEQKDIMAAVTGRLGSTSGAVQLSFSHLLAGVKFVKGDMGLCRIADITVKGVYGGDVSFVLDDAGSWVPQFDKTSVHSYSPVVSVRTESLDSGADITGNADGSTLFMVPQILPEGARIAVSYYDLLADKNASSLIVKEADIAGQMWSAGMTRVYQINIGTDFKVSFEDPGTQDAHYVMPHITYDMSGISDVVSDIEASVEYMGNSAQGGVVPSLLMLGQLSDRQKLGWWADKRITRTTTVNESSGQSSVTVSQPVGIRGGATLPLTDVQGTIVMFLPENDGITDRDVTLRITGMYGGHKINIGSHTFKQLCPSWNKSGIGVERIEDGATWPFGYKYDRKITYTNSGFYLGLGIIRAIYSYRMDSKVKDDEGDFVTVTPGKSLLGLEWKIQTVVLDYTALNKLGTVGSSTDGLVNTGELHDFSGGNDINQIETDLDKLVSGGNLSKKVNKEGSKPAATALTAVLKCNRVIEIESRVNDEEPDYSVEFEKDDSGKNIIEWFLPAAAEAATLVETQTGTDGKAADVVSALDGTYWSSNAVADDKNAYTYQYSKGTFVKDSHTVTADRLALKKVRAVCRK